MEHVSVEYWKEYRIHTVHSVMVCPLSSGYFRQKAGGPYQIVFVERERERTGWRRGGSIGQKKTIKDSSYES